MVPGTGGTVLYKRTSTYRLNLTVTDDQGAVSDPSDSVVVTVVR